MLRHLENCRDRVASGTSSSRFKVDNNGSVVAMVCFLSPFKACSKSFLMKVMNTLR